MPFMPVALLPVNERDQLFFSSNFMQQARNNQTVVGMAYGMGVGDLNVHVYAGAWLRVNDAVYPYIGLRTDNYQLGISYDITHSDLKKTAGFAGSSELSFIYFFNQKDKRNRIPCFFLRKSGRRKDRKTGSLYSRSIMCEK